MKCKKIIDLQSCRQVIQNPNQQQQQQLQTQPKKSDITQDLLLQHYTMTNKMCPVKGCFMPLMKKPNSDIYICGKHQQQIIFENNDQLKENQIDAEQLAKQIIENGKKRIQELELEESSNDSIQKQNSKQQNNNQQKKQQQSQQPSNNKENISVKDQTIKQIQQTIYQKAQEACQLSRVSLANQVEDIKKLYQLIDMLKNC